MSINFEAAIAAATANTSKKKGKAGARVTEKVIADVRRATEKHGDFTGLKAACISLHGTTEKPRFALYRGPVEVTVDDKVFCITKSATHSASLSKQGENMQDFVSLYNLLEGTPNKFHGKLAPMGDLPELPEEDQA